MKTGSVFGGILLVAGTCIGAGMLALPLIAAELGYQHAVALLLFIWVMMLLPALYTLEANLAFPSKNNSYSHMAYVSLGRVGQVVTNGAFLLLMYSLTAAYVTGGGQLINQLAQGYTTLPPWLSATAFTLLLGGGMIISTRSVDWINRSFFTAKAIVFALAFYGLASALNPELLGSVPPLTSQALLPAAPIFTLAFGFHIVVPSLVLYLGQHPRPLLQTLVLGSIIPLLVYILWLTLSMGIIPSKGPGSLADLQNTGDVSALIQALGEHSHHGANGLRIFANIAMITSFLGVALALFDFLAATLKTDGASSNRAIVGIATFLPPLLFALHYPQGFLIALRWGAVFVTLICVLIPTLMAWRMRQHPEFRSSFTVPGGSLPIVLSLGFGLCMMAVQVGLLMGWV